MSRFAPPLYLPRTAEWGENTTVRAAQRSKNVPPGSSGRRGAGPLPSQTDLGNGGRQHNNGKIQKGQNALEGKRFR